MTAPELLDWGYRTLGGLALVASFQAEQVVLIDLACQVSERPQVVTLGTGRLPSETTELMEQVRRRWHVRLIVVEPDRGEVEEMVGRHGHDLFFESVELRRLCCDVRKSRRLDRALLGYDGWVTGLRREQSPTRAGVQEIDRDPVRDVVWKLAPLAAWTRRQLWERFEKRVLPVHALYARGYTSIGCEPCTRATKAGEGERAGRWWSELDEIKECSVHWAQGRPQRAG